MKLTPLPPAFYTAVLNWTGGWHTQENPLRDNVDDALNDAQASLSPTDDYRILYVSIAEGRCQDVTEDAWRACSWGEVPIPDHIDRQRAERDDERDEAS